MPPSVYGLKRPQFKGFHLRICLKSCGTDLEDFFMRGLQKRVATTSCCFWMENICVLVLLVTSSTNYKKTRKLTRNRQNLKNRIEIFEFFPISSSWKHPVQNREHIYEKTGLETLRDEVYYLSPLSPAQLSWWCEENEKSSRSVHLILKMYFIFLNGVNEGN